MASSSQDSKNRPSSRKLRDTLGELETALNSWDQIIPPADDAASDVTLTNSSEPRSRRGAGSGIPDEMKRRTRALLNQLKEQIDELSDEATNHRQNDEKTGNA